MSQSTHTDPAGVAVAEEISIDELLLALDKSEIVKTLGIDRDDLRMARRDSDLLKTLRITHGIVVRLGESAVLKTFFLLPRIDQANFIRWIGMTDDPKSREDRTDILVFALKEGPLSSDASTEKPSRTSSSQALNAE
jgi:hypothetical protein